MTYDKAGQTAQLNPGALLGSDLFKKSQFEWMEQVLLPQLAKMGITEKGQITDTIGSIFSNDRGADLYGNMVLQRAQIRKNEKLNSGAYDIDQITALGKQQVSGKELETTAKLADLNLAMGEKILPIYTDAIVMLTGAIKQLNLFIEANPALSKALIISFGVVAAIATALGAVLLALSPFIASYALLYVGFAKPGVTGGVLLPILKSIGTAFTWLGGVLLFVGRALLLNPLGLAITVIAVAALLIYKYWEPIKTFFADLWAAITTIFTNAKLTISSIANDLWTNIKTAFTDVINWFSNLPAKFTDFGINIMHGLVNGITSTMGWVKNTVMNAGESVIGWFKEKLGIHSPSQVFA